MVASLLKIVSTGMQDERLQPPKGQPSLGSFLTVMVKAGRYATNWSRIDFDTAPDFGKSSVIRLPTKGELIGRVYLVTTMPDIATIQKRAYYARKPLKSANTNYSQVSLFGTDEHTLTTNLTFPRAFGPPIYPNPDYGLANFIGYQLDDLNVDAIYSISIRTSPKATSNTIFEFLLTDKALTSSEFDLLNTDTFLVAAVQDTGNGIIFIYSYNGLAWINTPPITNIENPIMDSIAYNSSQYIASGSYNIPSSCLMIENMGEGEVIVSPNFSKCQQIGYNGSHYVSVGLGSNGTISYSSDGLSWAAALNPAGVSPGNRAGGYSVAWLPTRSKWMAVGEWINTGIITTSLDIYGMNWTTPSFVPSIQSGKATCIAVNGSQIIIGGQFYEYPSNTNYIGSLIYSSDGGLTWTNPTDPAGTIPGELPLPSPITNAVAWTGSLWVAAGNWVNKSISFSSDGFTWLSAINPISTSGGTGITIALSPTDMIIGGLWSLTTNEGSTGSLSKASGTRLGYKWSTIVRPTLLDTNNVTIYGISYNSSPESYILVGEWADSTGRLLGTISLSTNGQSWSDPIIPADTNRLYSRAYSVATNGSVWIVVGYWRTSLGGTGNTIACSTNLSPQFYSDWQFSDTSDTGYGRNVVFDPTLGSGKFIAVGSWLNSQACIKVSTDQGGQLFNAPSSLAGIGGIGLCITRIVLYGIYILGGTFVRTSDSKHFSLLSVSIDETTGNATLNTIISQNYLDSTKSQTTNGIAWNGLIGPLAAYVAVGQWVFLNGNYATLSYSTDGIIWQEPTNPPGIISSATNKAVSVLWNGTQFVVMGQWNNGTIITSTDGKIWTTPINPPEAGTITTNSGSAATWNGSSWVIAGNWFNSQGTAAGNVDMFTYGINFSVPVNPELAKSGPAAAIVWNPINSTWIAGSQAGKLGIWMDDSTNSGILSSSTDGLTWTTPTTPRGISIIEFSQIAVINSRVYFVGSIDFSQQSLMTSNDGINWSIQPFTDNKSGNGNGIAWNGSMWVSVGYFQINNWGNKLTGQIITSTDGINWSNPITPIIPNTPIIQGIIESLSIEINMPINKLSISYSIIINAVAWNGSLWVAVGKVVLVLQEFNYNINQIITSPDGITWTAVRIAALDNSLQNYSALGVEAKSVAWNGSVWVVVGSFGENPGYITTSTDGINWSAPIRPSNASGQATAVAWNGSLWVVIGQWTDSDGQRYNITTSTDGIIWSAFSNIITGTNYFLKTITWNGTQFIIGIDVYDNNESPSNGLVLVSRDGLTWTNVNPSLPPINSIIGKRRLPYIKPQAADPNFKVYTQLEGQANGFTASWVRDPVYGTGHVALTTLVPGQPYSYTFRATQRSHWLTLGTYYSPPSIIDISLNLLTPSVGGFQSDLVGPHFGWTNNLGHSLIDSASITIGGNLVETIGGQLMEVLDEFQTPLEKVNEKSRQLCRAESGFTQKTFGYSNPAQTVTTHLPFWFSRGDPGCVLPIDALNVDEVRLTVNFKPLTSLYYTDSRTTTPAINVEGGSLWPMLGSQFFYEDPSGQALPNMEPGRTYITPTLPFPNLNMPNTLSIADSHLMVEYIYLDKAEANRFRIADLQVPIVQHYTLNPEDTNKNTFAKLRLDIPNPTRDLFFYCQRYEAPSLNAHFLATRDLSKDQTDPYSLWWPDATGLDARYYGTLKPGFSRSGSEPIRWLALNYSETLNRYSTENVALFRSMIPSMEQRKAPWINRYYYNLPFGCQNGLNPISMPLGEANLDKVQRISLSLGFHGITGDPTDSYAERFWVRTFAETYNIFRVYGGRGAMMFAY